MKKLSKRQEQVIGFVARGETDKEIAGRIGLKPNSVTKHVISLMRKLGAKSRAHAVFIRFSAR